MTAFLAKNSDMAGFADNVFIKRKRDRFYQNIISFFLMTYQVLLQASLHRYDRFSVKKLRRRDSFSCRQGRFCGRDFLTYGTCQGFLVVT